VGLLAFSPKVLSSEVLPSPHSTMGGILVSLADDVPQCASNHGGKETGRVGLGEGKCALGRGNESQFIGFAILHQPGLNGGIESHLQTIIGAQVFKLKVA
jgi:hypothetical protein